MKKIILSLLTLLLVSTMAQAQYNFAIGLRSGGTTGLTLKKNYGPTALEGIIGFWDDGFSATLLWEKNQRAFNEPGLRWYYGLGGHLAVYGDDFDERGPSWYRHGHHFTDGGLGLGVDGILGLEYKIPNAPIAVSIDLKPYLEIVTDGGAFFSPDPGIGIKVAF